MCINFGAILQTLELLWFKDTLIRSMQVTEIADAGDF